MSRVSPISAEHPLFCLFFVQLVQHIPYTEYVHYAQRPVIQPIAGTAFLVPYVSAVVWADISVKTAVVIGFYAVKYANITVAVAVGSLTEISVIKVFDVPDMCKSDPVAVLSHYVSYIVIGI